MAAEVEKLVRRWLDQTASALAESPPDPAAVRAAFGRLRGHVEDLLDDYFPSITLPARLWSNALLAQARTDLKAAQALARVDGDGRSPAAICMLLQMVFEKLAKAALARTDEAAFVAHRRSHAAASKLVQVLKLQAEYTDLRPAWRDVLPLVVALERAHPALAKKGPHLEYPWEAGDRMALPGTDLSIVREFDDARNLRGAKVLRFAQELSNRFDELFP